MAILNQLFAKELVLELSSKEWLPCSLIFEVKREQHWSLIRLNVSVNVFLANDTPDLFHRALWVICSLIHILRLTVSKDLLNDSLSKVKVVTLCALWTPDLNKVVYAVSSADIPGISIWDSFTINDVGMVIFGSFFVLSALISIDIVEIVTQKNGMLFGISHTKVKELLT